MSRAVSELVAAVLLTLVTAAVGVLVLYYFVSYISSALPASEERCKMVVVDVLVDRDGARAIVYNSGVTVCVVRHVCVMDYASGNVTELREVNEVVRPRELKILPPIRYLRAPFVVRVVSADGHHYDYLVG